jgi:hypothetical protein
LLLPFRWFMNKCPGKYILSLSGRNFVVFWWIE